jgi:predicted amino acid racemase
MLPSGDMGTNLEGHSYEFDDNSAGKTSFRAILDLGLLDVESVHLKPVDQKIEFLGSSSDMLVIDLGKNEQNYKTGDLIEFNLDYMGILRIMNSRYVEKRLR